MVILMVSKSKNHTLTHLIALIETKPAGTNLNLLSFHLNPINPNPNVKSYGEYVRDGREGQNFISILQ
jgi:hypothetical protein